MTFERDIAAAARLVRGGDEIVAGVAGRGAGFANSFIERSEVALSLLFERAEPVCYSVRSPAVSLVSPV